MSSNKSAKEALIKAFGAECFIDKLGLRKDKNRKYTSKSQYKRMKQLTYHHIQEKQHGGKATFENGAILSVENHEWFNKQSKEKQAEMNKAFQEYKKCNVEFVEQLDLGIKVNFSEISFEEPKEKKKEFNRAKEKREFRRRVEEDLEY